MQKEKKLVSSSRNLQQRTLDPFLVRKDKMNSTCSNFTSTNSNMTTNNINNSNKIQNNKIIILPWSRENLCVGNSNNESCYYAWDIISTIMIKDSSQNTNDLKKLLQELCVYDSFTRIESIFKFEILSYVIDHIMSENERLIFFNKTLPWMKNIVLNGPSFFTKELEILSQGENKEIIITHIECNILMSCGFFSIFPGRFSIQMKSGNFKHKLPPFNFIDLFCFAKTNRIESQYAKVRCLIQYFIYCSTNEKDMNHICLEIHRVYFNSFPNFEKSRERMQEVNIKINGFIEDSYGNLQVDFANKYIGGGVLSNGCVQEEIRFVNYPELIISRLFCESLLDNEVIFISGGGQYNISKGYANTFRFISGHSPQYINLNNNNNNNTETIQEEQKKEKKVELLPSLLLNNNNNNNNTMFVRNCCVVAMDAKNYRGISDNQYLKFCLIREIQKAFVAFKGTSLNSTLTSLYSGPIATGNWGCGAFNGDCEIKLLIQWCAASQAKRSLIYYTFDDNNNNNLCNRFHLVYQKIIQNEWTVGHVFTAIIMFGISRPFLPANCKIFDYILTLNKFQCIPLQ